jgi:hypothetical protein
MQTTGSKEVSRVRPNVPVVTEDELRDRMRRFEQAYGMTSDQFYPRYERRELPITDDFFVWAGLCGYFRLNPDGPDDEGRHGEEAIG